MGAIEVDFVARRRVADPAPDEDEWATPEVPHPSWCVPAECSIGYDGASVHTRVISRVADVTVTVEQVVSDDYQGPVEVHVGGHGAIGLTDEQVPLLIEGLKDAAEFIVTSCSSAVAS